MRVKTSSETVSCRPDPSKGWREARALELVRWPEICLCRKQVTNLPDRKLVLDSVSPRQRASLQHSDAILSMHNFFFLNFFTSAD